MIILYIDLLDLFAINQKSSTFIFNCNYSEFFLKLYRLDQLLEINFYSYKNIIIDRLLIISCLYFERYPFTIIEDPGLLAKIMGNTVFSKRKDGRDISRRNPTRPTSQHHSLIQNDHYFPPSPPPLKISWPSAKLTLDVDACRWQSRVYCSCKPPCYSSVARSNACLWSSADRQWGLSSRSWSL